MARAPSVYSLAREIEEKLLACAPQPPSATIPVLEPITIRPVELSPQRWGFNSRAEMEAAWAAEGDDHAS